MADIPPPWGALAPNPLERSILRVTRSAPAKGPARAVASALRNAILLGRGGAIDVELYGFKARLRPKLNLADKRAVFFPQHWDAAERARLDASIRPGFVFIDIGANTGLYSLFVAARAGPEARVIAVEPQPEVKDWLAFNIAANGFETIEHVDAAIAGGIGEATLSLPGRNRGAASIAHAGERSVTVPTLGVLDLMDRCGIEHADALKIDIEGAEDQALPPFFEACPATRLPRMIIMETRSRDWSVDCVQLARDVGYVELERTSMNTVLARDERRA